MSKPLFGRRRARFGSSSHTAAFLGWNRRLVAVPIEVVAIAGRQLAALDMARKEFDEAPTWTEAQAAQIDQNEIIRIALYRR